MSSTARRRQALLLAGALGVGAAVLLVVVRLAMGVTLGSDAYSYLAWAHGLVHGGRTDHVASDYTVPKPLELLAAGVGEVLQLPLAVFGWWTMLGLLGAIAASAALGYRLSGRDGAIAAALLAGLLPVTWRWSLAGDSNVPYAALAVGAAAAGAGSPAASGLLGAAGLLRPEAWGLAVISALAGWRRATARARGLAVAAVVAPPLVWLFLDRVFTGDSLYSTHVVDRYDDAYHPPILHAGDIPQAVWDRIPDVVGWPLLLLGLAALIVGLLRRPLDAAVLFPLALALALLLVASRGQVSRDDLGRMLSALCLFCAAGGGALLGGLPAEIRRAALPAAVALCALAVLVDVGPARPALRDGFSAANDQAALASDLETRIAPRARRLLAAGGVAQTERGWQGAFSLYAGIDRRRVVTALIARQRGLQPTVFLRRAGQPDRWVLLSR